MQVSKADSLLDEELEKWRTRPPGEYAYLHLDAHIVEDPFNRLVGSCAYNAIEVGELNAKAMWESASLLLAQAKEKAPDEQVKVVFTCERHAAHGAHTYLETEASPQAGEPRIVAILLPCVDAVPPDLVGKTYKAGASAIQMIGYPPDGCAKSQGNLWREGRLTRERKPLLRAPFLFEEITLPSGSYSLVVKVFAEDSIQKTWTLAIQDVKLSNKDIYPITLVAPGLTY